MLKAALAEVLDIPSQNESFSCAGRCTLERPGTLPLGHGSCLRVETVLS